MESTEARQPAVKVRMLTPFGRWSRPLWPLVAPALVAWCISGCAKPKPPEVFSVQQEEWTHGSLTGRRILTDHFELYTTVRDEEFLGLLPRFMESAHAQYRQLVPSRVKNLPRLATYLFASRSDWERFTVTHWPHRAAIYRRIQSGAFTEGTTSVAYYLDRQRTLSVLAHEGLHQYVAQQIPGELPAWLNEGLACYCESFGLHRGVVTFTPRDNPNRLRSLCEGINAKTLLPLREILRTHAGEVIAATDRRVYNYYAQAWALIAYLLDPPDGPHAAGLRRLLEALGTEEYRFGIGAYVAATEPPDGIPINAGEAAFHKYVTDDLAAFEEGFRSYLLRLALLTRGDTGG